MSLTLQILIADKVADGLFAATDGLVPGALGAVCGVLNELLALMTGRVDWFVREQTLAGAPEELNVNGPTLAAA